VLVVSAVLVDMVALGLTAALALADSVVLAEALGRKAWLAVLDLVRTALLAESGAGVEEAVALFPMWVLVRAVMRRKPHINMSGMVEILVVRKEISLASSQVAAS